MRSHVNIAVSYGVSIRSKYAGKVATWLRPSGEKVTPYLSMRSAGVVLHCTGTSGSEGVHTKLGGSPPTTALFLY